jgi:putative inorganic carbon (HCO3(-)) transporter
MTSSTEHGRYLLALAVVLTCALFLPSSADPVNVVKLVSLVLCALAALALVAWSAVRHRLLVLPTGPAAWATAALAVAVTVAAVAAPSTSTAILGAYGRNSGLLAYGSALLLVAVALTSLRGPRAQALLVGVTVAGLFTASYGLLQWLGIDAIPWNNPFNPIIAALGNPNFASAYMGIVAPVAIAGALWTGWSRAWRVACGITGALCLLVPLLSDAVQGAIAASAGLSVVAVSVLLGQPARVKRRGLAAVAGAAALSLALLVAGAVAAAGPFARFFTGISFESRRVYWDAALAMFRDEPALGVGLDHYGLFWRTHRNAESVELLGVAVGGFSDSAHSVPLQMLAQGGLLLGLAYLAFVAVTGWYLVRGLLRLDGADRVLLSAFGGGWLAYQVQSLVSIDQVPLIVLHVALASGVLAVAGPPPRVLRLPGAAPEPAPDVGRRRRVPVQQRVRGMSGIDVAALCLLGVVGLGAAWQALAPLRADVAVRTGDLALTQGLGNDALDAYGQATDTLPASGRYWLKQAQLLTQVQRTEAALEAYEHAVEADSFNVTTHLSRGALTESAGDLETSRRAFERAAGLDPWNPETVVAAARFHLRHSGAQRARELLLAGVRRRPDAAVLWASLGDAHAVLEDPTAARAAYDRALALHPDEPTAVAGLQKLAAQR